MVHFPADYSHELYGSLHDNISDENFVHSLQRIFILRLLLK